VKLLLDTHALIWWFQGSPRLSPKVREAIDQPGALVLVSAVSAFEIALKHRLGKLPEAAILVRQFSAMTAEQGFEPLPVTLAHGLAAGDLAIGHRDPFDRLLIAQAMLERATLASNEQLFDAAGLDRLW
jgi:PIN domain nuclease of toxin-antitoxin system